MNQLDTYITTELGDRVAFDRRGSGPTVIFVAGAGPWREIDTTTTRTSELLAERGVASIVYDRLGRGMSPAAGPITLEREIAALRALIATAGGGAVLCGHSSGCSIALYAAASGLPVAGLALWEAPLGPQDSGGREWAAAVTALIEAGDLRGALMAYMVDMPPEILEFVLATPAMVDQAGSLRPDAESLAWAESAPHADLFSGIRVPVLAMAGDETYDIMLSAAESITSSIPGARFTRMPGGEHDWEPEAMAAELARFFADEHP